MTARRGLTLPTESRPQCALPCLALTATLAACGTAPALNELHVENDGGGSFSGKAGPEWTRTELKQEVATAICGRTAPARFRLKTRKQVWSFKGKC